MRQPVWAGKSLLLVAGVLLLAAGDASAQTPPMVRDKGHLRSAQDWMDAGSYHVARRHLEEIVRQTSPFEQNRDVLYLLVQSSFQDRDYEEAYQWASEFIRDYPHDQKYNSVLFIEGLSAYQTHRNSEALELLTKFLAVAPDHPRRGAAAFWKAMAELDQGAWTKAEDDMKDCLRDSADAPYRDYILFGWALSLERRGSWSESADRFEQLLREYPASDLATDARIRLASVLLRQGQFDRTLRILSDVRPESDYQRQEYLLLQAEASVQAGKFSDARRSYREFTRNYSGSRYQRQALYGLAWASVRSRDYAGAQGVFDTLSEVRDSLGFASMYESGVLSLLQQKFLTALSTFDTLTDRSPYDRDAVQAYYQMGLIHYRDKHYHEARRYFQLAARLFPDSPLRPYAYHMLGESYFALADYANAQYAFVQVKHLSTDPDILAPTLFRQGIALYHLGRFRSSVESLSDYLRQFPRDRYVPEGLAWRGEALYQDDRFAEAEQAFAEALRRSNNPKRADAGYGLAWALFEQKKYAQAAAAFDRFTTQFPDDQRVTDASLRKADAYFSMGEYDKANTLYAALGSKKGGRQNEYAAFQIAMSYVQRGDAERGIEELRGFLSRFPSSMYDEVAQFNIAWIYFSREQYSQALAEFHTLLRLYAESQLLPRVFFNMGDAYYNLKQYDSARVYYKRVVDEFPSSLLVTDALNGLQYTYEAEGKPAAAAAEIEKVLEKRPAGAREDELLMKKGDILFGQGDFGGAVHEYQRALQQNPSKEVKAKILNQLGRTYEMNDNPDRAAAYYEQIVSETPDAEVAPAATLALGLVRIKQRQYDRAAEVLNDFARKYPQSPLLSEVRYQAGVAMMNLPKSDRALEQFRTVISQYPDQIFADRSRLRMAELLRRQKEYRIAIDTLSGIMSHRSDDVAAEALLMIGDTYLDLKDIKDGMQAYNDLVKQYPDLPRFTDRAKIGLGIAYERQRDRKRARAMYEEVAGNSTDPEIRKEAEEKMRRLKK